MQPPLELDSTQPFLKANCVESLPCQDSNLEPPEYQADALPIELHRLGSSCLFIIQRYVIQNPM